MARGGAPVPYWFMRIRPLLGAVLALLVITGCGGPSALPAPPPADAIPDLARAYDSDPDDVDLGLLLASAYRAADRTDDGLELIARLRERDASRPDVLAMGGLFLEDAGQVAAARDAYAAALAANPDGALAEQVERRLERMVLEALREDVRVALARESDLADAPDPATIGVFPFGYEGTVVMRSGVVLRAWTADSPEPVILQDRKSVV